MVVILGGCLILQDNKILLIYKNDENHWEIPGGISEKGEEPEKTAVREADEELGIKVEIIQEFGTFEFKLRDEHFENHVYEAKIIEGKPTPGEKNIEKVEWLPIEELEKYDLAPNIKLILEELRS